MSAIMVRMQDRPRIHILLTNSCKANDSAGQTAKGRAGNWPVRKR
jgi:hypothetical protein